MRNEYRQSQEVAVGTCDCLSAAESRKDRETVSDAYRKSDILFDARIEGMRQSHGNQGFQGIQKDDNDPCRKAKDPCGIGSTGVSGTVFPDILMIEDLPDHQSPGDRPEEIADQDKQYCQHDVFHT